MPHDAHFLERLDRVKAEETDLALGLYRDHELVRFILSHAKLPPEAPRVAIALDDGADGPWIVVARNGAFVTCLGRGMTPRGLPTISRAQLDAWGQKHEEVRRRIALAKERGALKGHLARRVGRAGRWLAREDFLALAAIAEPIGPTLFRRHLDAYTEYSDALPVASVMGDPRTELDRAVYIELAQSTWAMGHFALAVAEGGDREFLRQLAEVASKTPGAPLAWAFLYETLAVPFAARNAWCAAKMGKLSLGTFKSQAARPSGMIAQAEASFGLFAIGARHSGLRAEAMKALEAQSADDDEGSAKMREFVRTVARVHEDNPGLLVSDAYNLGRDQYMATCQDLDEGSKFRFATAEEVPDDLARTAALNAWISVFSEQGLAFLPSLALLAGRSKAEDFYYPAELCRDVRVDRTLGEGISLVEIHKERFPAHTTVRAEAKPGRNEPCSCGSGKKYKKCCGKAA